ncbi:PilT/PilU family type 4a pilus ATPase [Bergeriella denitrificans]|uniref:Twitching motility - like protein n=1 Tax=Bergeriella denitrificans TaxID=494 RepID=A0A378UKD9_BERDE|nr:PilT/PilU family type 4a pilus ATPase [Bergeriella denitrificans]STZ77173.1 twitching motility - like protein [Bergeriella denitrificans]
MSHNDFFSKPAALPVHPLLERMFREAEERGASDIFISAGFPPAFKADGTLFPMRHPPLEAEETAAIVRSTMSAEQAAAFERSWELNYAAASPGGTRYRINAYRGQGRTGMVLRRINRDIPAIAALNLPAVLETLALAPRGLLVLAGPANSGKSATAAALLDHRNRHLPGHILTIEDPIEFIHKPMRCIFTQREIGIDTPDRASAVQSAMRQSPDVVALGEIRNAADMDDALQLAQAGHLCIITLHAGSAVQAVERILHFYPETRRGQAQIDLALNLNAVIGQRLAVKKDQSGRIAAVDLLLNTPAMQDALFKGRIADIRSLMARSAPDGMQTFNQNLFDLYTRGIISREEALRQADSANDLQLQIRLYDEGRQTEYLYDRIGDLNLMS